MTIETKVDEALADLSGGKVFLRRWPPAEGAAETPIVLLHDSLGCVDMWRNFPAEA